MAGKLTVAVAAAMALALAGVPQAGADGGGRVVQTGNGAVSGTVTSDYRLFGSIPHAAAPVRANRWRDPRPVAPQRGERASDVEDCLYLDVVTPVAALLQVHGEFASPAFDLPGYAAVAPWLRGLSRLGAAVAVRVRGCAADAGSAVGPTDFATDHQCDFWGQQ